MVFRFSGGFVESPSPAASGWVRFSICLATGLLVWLWSTWPTLARLQENWVSLPQYSHGYFVPLLAAYILWARRSLLLEDELLPSVWAFPCLLAGMAMRWTGTAYNVDSLDAAGLIPLLFGVFLIAGGMPAGIWSCPAVLFLLLMVPLPFRVETAFQQTLLRVATATSTYLLQTMGLPAYAEGNVIQLTEARLGVLDACSGLRMSMVCMAMAAMAAILSTATAAQRVILFCSGVPLALATNVLRICAMGVIAENCGPELAKRIFHDASGYVMMPLAVMLFLAEIRVLNWLFEQDADGRRRPLFMPQTA